MKVGRFTLSAALLAGAITLVNCGDAPPSAPSNTPTDSAVAEGGLLGNILNGLLSCSALPAATTVRTIGPAGGTIQVGPHVLTIPAGALSRNYSIKAVVKSEHVSRVHFEPEGLRFSRPATLTMSYANCGLLNALSLRQIAYVRPNLSLLDHLLSFDNILSRRVTTQIEHFSDYAVEQFSFSDHVINWGQGASR